TAHTANPANGILHPVPMSARSDVAGHCHYSVVYCHYEVVRAQMTDNFVVANGSLDVKGNLVVRAVFGKRSQFVGTEIEDDALQRRVDDPVDRDDQATRTEETSTDDEVGHGV